MATSIPDAPAPQAPALTRGINRVERALGIAAWLGIAGFLTWVMVRVFRASTRMDSGDFKHFFWAAEAMREGEDVYAAGLGGYIYPPAFAWAIQPLVPLGRVWAERSWAGVNLLLTAASLVLAFRVISRTLRDRADGLTLGGVCFLGMIAAFGPFRWQFEEGQTDTLVLFGFCLALFALDRLPAIAGVALGIALTIKHQAIIAFPYLLVRRRWLTAGCMLGGAMFIAALPAITLGISRTLDLMGEAYGYMLHLFSGQGEIEGRNLNPITWDLSVSITSAVARALEDEMGVPMTATLAISVAIGLVVLGLTWLAYARFGMPLFRGRGGSGEAAPRHKPLVMLEWLGLLVAIIAFSPQSMNRHAFILLPLFMLAAYVIVVPRRGVTRWPVIAGLAVYIAARELPPGEPRFQEALTSWRSIGGASWGLLCFWLGAVYSTLSFATAGERATSREVSDSAAITENSSAGVQALSSNSTA